MSYRKTTIARRLGIGLGSIGFVGGVFSFAVTTTYLQSAPIAPNPERGIVYPVEIRGETIYLTKRDYAIQTWMFPSSCLLTMLGVSLMVWAQSKKNEQA